MNVLFYKRISKYLLMFLYILKSAGVGRTGTFIAVDYLMQHVRTSDVIDIYSYVMKMRNNRPNMVQTEVLRLLLSQTQMLLFIITITNVSYFSWEKYIYFICLFFGKFGGCFCLCFGLVFFFFFLVFLGFFCFFFCFLGRGCFL